MEIKISIIDDILAIVKVVGEFSIFDEDFDLFAKEVVAYSKMGIFRFVVDLDECAYIDSSGVGVIIRLATSAMKKETLVCVLCNQPIVRKVFMVSNVEKIIKFVDSIDDGLKFYEETTDFKKKV